VDDGGHPAVDEGEEPAAPRHLPEDA
jgi:hypothetical protein